jgi:hypothetical protein
MFSTDKVRHGLASLMRETQADEIMVNGQIFETEARLRSREYSRFYGRSPARDSRQLAVGADGLPPPPAELPAFPPASGVSPHSAVAASGIASASSPSPL